MHENAWMRAHMQRSAPQLLYTNRVIRVYSHQTTGLAPAVTCLGCAKAAMQTAYPILQCQGSNMPATASSNMVQPQMNLPQVLPQLRADNRGELATQGDRRDPKSQNSSHAQEPRFTLLHTSQRFLQSTATRPAQQALAAALSQPPEAGAPHMGRSQFRGRRPAPAGRRY